MSNLSTEMTADFLSLWEEVPVYLSYGSVEIKVLLSHADRSRDLDLGGFAENAPWELALSGLKSRPLCSPEAWS